MNRLVNLWPKSKPDRERRTRACRSPAPEVGQMIACQLVLLRVTAPIADGLWSALTVLSWLVWLTHRQSVETTPHYTPMRLKICCCVIAKIWKIPTTPCHCNNGTRSISYNPNSQKITADCPANYIGKPASH